MWRDIERLCHKHGLPFKKPAMFPRDSLIGLLAILLVRSPWAARAAQVALVVGAAEWVRTPYELAGARARSGEPATRLVIILGCVALLTFLSALVFRVMRAREWYRIASSR